MLNNTKQRASLLSKRAQNPQWKYNWVHVIEEMLSHRPQRNNYFMEIICIVSKQAINVILK